jgi:hypothetical protein
VPLTKKGRKIMRAMRSTYKSPAKAKRVFYASANAGKIKGVERKAARRRRSRR